MYSVCTATPSAWQLFLRIDSGLIRISSGCAKKQIKWKTKESRLSLHFSDHDRRSPVGCKSFILDAREHFDVGRVRKIEYGVVDVRSTEYSVFHQDCGIPHASILSSVEIECPVELLSLFFLPSSAAISFPSCSHWIVISPTSSFFSHHPVWLKERHRRHNMYGGTRTDLPYPTPCSGLQYSTYSNDANPSPVLDRIRPYP